MKKNLLFALFIIISFIGFAQEESIGPILLSTAPGKITPEFLWTLGRVSDPRLSPDGKEALYNVRSYDLKLNKGNSDIWKVNIQTSVAIHLTTDSANENSARWNHDGKKIYYL